MTQNIVLIGFGTVGQGLAEILIDKKADLERFHGYEAKVVAVSDTLKGSVCDPAGLDLAKLLELVREGKSLEEYPTGEKGWDSLTTIKNVDADVMVELAFTDLETGQPAIDHVTAALKSGKNVSTTNKGPVALACGRLSALAEEKGLSFRFEGTVMSGTPVLNTALYGLAGSRIDKIQGILNGTTNYILTQMEEGESYEDALLKAQELGYAEAVPDADVLGWDARGKVAILANVVMHAPLAVSDVECEGITKITLDNIRTAAEAGERYKLIGSIERTADGVKAKVCPRRVPLSHPLSSVMGATNAVTYTTDLLGEVTVVGAGAGRIETGYSVLNDLLDIHRCS
jgi:homoserine dehydrogenase